MDYSTNTVKCNTLAELENLTLYDVQQLEGLEKLQILNISKNNISVVPWQLLPRSNLVIDLQQNTIDCNNCQNKWLKQTSSSSRESIWDSHQILGLSSHDEANLTVTHDKKEVLLHIENVTSHELGFVACTCLYCDSPVFDVIELRFETNVSVSLEEDTHDSHLIVQGYPINDLNLTIFRYADNMTETHQISDLRTSFFNDSLLVALIHISILMANMRLKCVRLKIVPLAMVVYKVYQHRILGKNIEETKVISLNKLDIKRLQCSQSSLLSGTSECRA
uniref:Uncharacterized protein n=1 Tax=Acrobeloides nanus TaxID=290746 RepID=A0A914E3D8_9BILA